MVVEIYRMVPARRPRRLSRHRVVGAGKPNSKIRQRCLRYNLRFHSSIAVAVRRMVLMGGYSWDYSYRMYTDRRSPHRHKRVPQERNSAHYMTYCNSLDTDWCAPECNRCIQ